MTEPETHDIAVSVSAGSPRVRVRVEVIPADAIETEPSSTPRYLRLRTGDIQVYRFVWISVDGDWHELTSAELPEGE